MNQLNKRCQRIITAVNQWKERGSHLEKVQTTPTKCLIWGLDLITTKHSHACSHVLHRELPDSLACVLWWVLIPFSVWFHDFVTDFKWFQSHAYEISAMSDHSASKISFFQCISTSSFLPILCLMELTSPFYHAEPTVKYRQTSSFFWLEVCRVILDL